MIKGLLTGKDGRTTILLGLSFENLARLGKGQPIKFNLSDLGLGDQDVVIMAGTTEEAMADEIAKKIPVTIVTPE